MIRSGAVRVAELLATPLVPADYLDIFDPLRRGADLRGRIEEVQRETPDAATIVIKAGADWAGHIPGQYVRVGVDVDGVRHWRAYSLTHGPRTDGRITITVKAVPGGVVSTQLVHHCPVGSLVHLEPAAGEFVLPPEGGKFTFVTAGSGITPVIGMLRNLFPATESGVLKLPRSQSFDIVVVHISPSEPDSIFIQNLKELDAAGAIRLLAHYDDRDGILDIDELSALVPDLNERATYACGPAGLLDALTQHHEREQIALQIEAFRVAYVEPGEGGSISFSQSAKTVIADGATPILNAAEDADVLLPSGCRMGICYGCVIPMSQGSVRDLRTGAVTHVNEGDTVKVQTCINAAAGPCTFDH